MKILIIGSTGMLGRSLFKVLSREIGIDVITAGRSPFSQSANHIEVDLTDDNSALRILECEPEVVIYCAANTSITLCEKNKDYAELIHATFPGEISKRVRRFFYISTDSVFDGKNAPYGENDKINPKNFYALSKVMGEKAVLKNCNRSVVIRTNMYGIESSRKASLVEWAIDNLEKNNEIFGFTDLFFNAIYTEQLANAILFLLEKEFSGTINVAGNYSVSKFEFLQLFARRAGYSDQLIIPKESSSFFSVSRPKNTTLSVSLLKQLGFDDLELETGLEMLMENLYGNCQN